MRTLVSLTVALFIAVATAANADGTLSYSNSFKTGKFNRKQYNNR